MQLRWFAAVISNIPEGAYWGWILILEEAVSCGHSSGCVSCGHLGSLEWPRLLRSLAVICGHWSGRVSCGHLRSLEWPRLLRSLAVTGVAASLAVTCGHWSGRVSCGHLRSLEWPRLLQSLAVTGVAASLAVTCGHLRSLAVTGVAASLAVTCGHLRSLEWLRMTALSKINFCTSCVLNVKLTLSCLNHFYCWIFNPHPFGWPSKSPLYRHKIPLPNLATMASWNDQNHVKSSSVGLPNCCSRTIRNHHDKVQLFNGI